MSMSYSLTGKNNVKLFRLNIIIRIWILTHLLVYKFIMALSFSLSIGKKKEKNMLFKNIVRVRVPTMGILNRSTNR
jgi:hypothetical protein